MYNVRVLWSLIGGLLLLVSVVAWAWYKDSPAAQPAAVVGEKTISEAEWIAALKEKYGQQVLEDMIEREVVFQEAERLGLTVDPQRVEEEIARIRESYGPGQDFETALREQAGTDLDALRREITYQLLLQELATHDVAVSDDEMLAYFNQRKERYARPLQVHLQQIVVASRTEAEQVRRELAEGANFATLAKERSIDPLTAADGGDLGWVAANDGDLPEQVKQAMAELSLHQDSQPIPLDNGQYAILRVLERKEAVQLSFDEVKEQIRRELALARVESLDQVLERLKAAAGVHVPGKD